MATLSAASPPGSSSFSAHTAEALKRQNPQAIPSSAQGLLALLKEENTQLQAAALLQLKDLVETHWMELADVLPDMCV
ncbi:hypothetical protein Efla_007062 [Eimeria flavescens]